MALIHSHDFVCFQETHSQEGKALAWNLPPGTCGIWANGSAGSGPPDRAFFETSKAPADAKVRFVHFLVVRGTLPVRLLLFTEKLTRSTHAPMESGS